MSEEKKPPFKGVLRIMQEIWKRINVAQNLYKNAAPDSASRDQLPAENIRPEDAKQHHETTI